MADANGPILVLHAHPYPRSSRAGAALVSALGGLAATEMRSLYDLYPDFDVDVAAEQAALVRARLIVWLHPMYWYGVPALLKHWFDTVLIKGWAYGEGGGALVGKDCLWVVTTGGDEAAFSAQGRHGHPFADFVAPVEQTARYCGMHWLAPHVVHGAAEIPDAVLAASAADLRRRLESWRETRARQVP
jgi:glutathione-regulated potassium-efflux system ancillary protein KefF